MGVNRLPKTVTRQYRGRDLNPGPSAPESSTLTTRLPRHPVHLGNICHHATPLHCQCILASFSIQRCATRLYPLENTLHPN